MAGRKENLKGLFTNTRTRVIIIFTAIIVISIIVIGVVKFRKTIELNLGSANLAGSPNIQSIPGALNQTEQYAKLQETQNTNEASTALQQGGSAIPTIIRSQAITDGVVPVGQTPGQSGVGFSTLAMEDQGGPQRSLWTQVLKDSSCSKASVDKVTKEGAFIGDLKNGCTCVQLRDLGYQLTDLETICSCPELKAAGFDVLQFKNAGFTAERLKRCGFNACELRNSGFNAQQMKDSGFSDGELAGAGFPATQIAQASGLPTGITEADIRKAGCDVDALKRLRQAGVSAAAIRRINGCSAAQMLAAGFSPQDLHNAGYTAAELKNLGIDPASLAKAQYSAADLLKAGLSPDDLAKAGFKPNDITAGENELAGSFDPAAIKKAGCTPDALKKEKEAGISASQIKLFAGCSDDALKAAGFLVGDCSADSLKAQRAAGVTATEIKQRFGCSTQAMLAAGYTPEELRAAGITAAELKNAGVSVADLKKAGFSPKELRATGLSAGELKDAGFSPEDLKDAGFSPAELKNAGFSASDLKAAGISPKDLKDAGYTIGELQQAGVGVKDLQDAGFTNAQLKNAGVTLPVSEVAGLDQPTIPGLSAPSVAPLPGIPGVNNTNSLAAQQAESNKQLQAILKKQNAMVADQRYQQKIQQRTMTMQGVANQYLQGWKKVSTQVYMAGTEPKVTEGGLVAGVESSNTSTTATATAAPVVSSGRPQQPALIKTGDVLFAVLDTSVNSDEPGPILATIVSGKLKGAKLIGSFTLPANSDKMVINFNTLSVPGAAKAVSISAYAIDPNTARTALSSNTNHHYLLRYGSLFASSFLEGFGNAFQSADTTVTIGGTGGGDNITVQNGIGRSALENAVIGLATLGKSWGQAAQKTFNTPTTVDVYSGTGLGILFTQDLVSL